MMAIVGTAAVVIAIIALNVACMVAVHNNHPLRKRRGASCQIEPSSVSSAGVERMFSKAGKLYDDAKQRQEDETLEAALFAAANTE